MENLVSKQCRPDQTPHYVASDLGLHCLPMTHLRVFRKERVVKPNLCAMKKMCIEALYG